MPLISQLPLARIKEKNKHKEIWNEYLERLNKNDVYFSVKKIASNRLVRYLFFPACDLPF